MQNLVIEKDNDVYDIYILLDTKHFYVKHLYKGTDVGKAKDVINYYYDKHAEDIEQRRKKDLNLLEKLI